MRPRIKLPLWAALAIAGAAYGYRSLVLRRGDFSLDAMDGIVVAVFLAALLLAWLARRSAANESADRPDDEGDDERSGPGSEG